MLEIPVERLSDDILLSILEEFIAREGTDYGAVECSFAQKVEQLKQQLHRGELVVTFDHYTESCTLLTRRDFVKAQAATNE